MWSVQMINLQVSPGRLAEIITGHAVCNDNWLFSEFPPSLYIYAYRWTGRVFANVDKNENYAGP